MPTVREVFERAYGAIPEGATCHVGHWGGPGMGWQMEPTIINRMHGASWPEALRRRLYGNEPTYEFEVGPDISDRDAEAFRGFFGDDYDAALDALTKEESEDSIHPDEIIKIANALAKFVLEGTGTQGVTVEDFAGYYLKASGAYERISADGTGESPVLSTHLGVMGEGK